MVFKNCHRPNSGAVIYTDKDFVTIVGGSATSLKQMKLIYLSQKEHGFCFFNLEFLHFIAVWLKHWNRMAYFLFAAFL